MEDQQGDKNGEIDAKNPDLIENRCKGIPKQCKPDQ
jgi:hypothetical protein